MLSPIYRPPSHPSTHPSIRSSIHSALHPVIHLPTHRLSLHPFIYPSIHQPSQPLIHSSIHLSICPLTTIYPATGTSILSFTFISPASLIHTLVFLHHWHVYTCMCVITLNCSSSVQCFSFQSHQIHYGKLISLKFGWLLLLLFQNFAWVSNV